MAKYDPLKQYLQELRTVTAIMIFSEIERILGAPLPKSAREYRAWWANGIPGGSHVQSEAWLDAGYGVDIVDFGRERVTFKRNCS